MKELLVSIEINGIQQTVGYIRGNDYTDACFLYDDLYRNIPGIRPISISLPLQENAFSPEETKRFFEGLLPEGFSRRAVADWVRSGENDYLRIIEALGQECLGAIMVSNGGSEISGGAYEHLTLSRMKALAAEGATTSVQVLLETHLSLTGATGKAGLYFDELNQEWYLPLGNAASTHIVKQSHVRFDQIVLNEQICMETAKNIGIDVAESFIVNVADQRKSANDADVLYATKRYDRLLSDELVDGLRRPYRLHQEDFAQALGISAADKYENEKQGYLGRMFEVIRNHSSNPIEDQLKLWDRIIFNYLIGNADCHLKNYSLLYDADMGGIRLAPAYDIVCTRTYKSTKDTSLYIGNEQNMDAITRASFELAAREAGLGEKMAMRRFDELTNLFEEALSNAVCVTEDKGFLRAKEFGQRILEVSGYRHLN